MSGSEQFLRLSNDFVDTAKEYLKAQEAPRLERLRGLRLDIAIALLDLPAGAVEQIFGAAMPAIAAACFQTSIRRFTRSAAENEVFARGCERLTPWHPDRDPLQGMAALLLSWHAFELKFVPPLASLSPAARRLWLIFLCETPPAFARIGDADEFSLFLPKLCERVGEYLANAGGSAVDAIEIFNNSSMFMQDYFNEFNLRETMRARGAIIEQILDRGGADLNQLRVMRPVRERPRVGFISFGVSDGTETVFLAAHMEHLDRHRYDVRLYSLGEPAGTVGIRCRTWAQTYVRLPKDVPFAVARLRREDLDMAIFCTNLTAVSHRLTQIAAHRVARVQASTMASPVTTGLRNMDVMISGEANETADSLLQYTERLVCLPGALNCYPFQYMLAGAGEPEPVSRSSLGIPDGATVFFSSANFYKIVPELSQRWIDVLRQVPGSYLVLMPFNPNWSSHYPVNSFLQRLTEQSRGNLDVQRVRVLSPVPTIAHLHRIIALADVYLDAFPFSGACSLYDPLIVGVPVVARMGKVCRSRHSKAILEQEGLGDWVAADADSYVRLAATWGNHPEKRHAERLRLARAREAGFRLTDTAAYAAKLMPTLDGVLSDWDRRSDAVQREDAAGLCRRITELAHEVGKRQRSFGDQNLVVSVVLPYLRAGGSRRLIDVGACLGAVAKPFLDEGWHAVLFEPDTRCHQPLAALVDGYPGQARLEQSAVTAAHDGTVAFHLSSLPGLSGLSASPFAPDVATIAVPGTPLGRYIARNGLDDVDFIKIDAEGHDLEILGSLDFGKIAPRLIMVEFGDHFAGQDRAADDVVLRQMRRYGYRACVVCLHALGDFKRQQWRTRLLAIGIDAMPSLKADERLFGNILFFQEQDRDFLPSLCDWLEQLHKWL